MGVKGAGDGMRGREPDLRAEHCDLKKVVEVGQELSGAELPTGVPQASLPVSSPAGPQPLRGA